MIYCFDIDGTLCTNTDGDYSRAQPCYEIIAQVNRLYDEGHRILLYTARGATTRINWHELTERQLKDWDVHYHAADVYIDNRAINLADWKRGGYRANLQSLEDGAKDAN